MKHLISIALIVAFASAFATEQQLGTIDKKENVVISESDPLYVKEGVPAIKSLGEKVQTLDSKITSAYYTLDGKIDSVATNLNGKIDQAYYGIGIVQHNVDILQQNVSQIKPEKVVETDPEFYRFGMPSINSLWDAIHAIPLEITNSVNYINKRWYSFNAITNEVDPLFVSQGIPAIRGLEEVSSNMNSRIQTLDLANASLNLKVTGFDSAMNSLGSKMTDLQNSVDALSGKSMNIYGTVTNAVDYKFSIVTNNLLLKTDIADLKTVIDRNVQAAVSIHMMKIATNAAIAKAEISSASTMQQMKDAMTKFLDSLQEIAPTNSISAPVAPIQPFRPAPIAPVAFKPFPWQPPANATNSFPWSTK